MYNAIASKIYEASFPPRDVVNFTSQISVLTILSYSNSFQPHMRHCFIAPEVRKIFYVDKFLEGLQLSQASKNKQKILCLKRPPVR